MTSSTLGRPAEVPSSSRLPAAAAIPASVAASTAPGVAVRPQATPSAASTRRRSPSRRAGRTRCALSVSRSAVANARRASGKPGSPAWRPSAAESPGQSPPAMRAATTPTRTARATASAACRSMRQRRRTAVATTRTTSHTASAPVSRPQTGASQSGMVSKNPISACSNGRGGWAVASRARTISAGTRPTTSVARRTFCWPAGEANSRRPAVRERGSRRSPAPVSAIAAAGDFPATLMPWRSRRRAPTPCARSRRPPRR